jgi:hypothetical protein
VFAEVVVAIFDRTPGQVVLAAFQSRFETRALARTATTERRTP